MVRNHHGKVDCLATFRLWRPVSSSSSGCFILIRSSVYHTHLCLVIPSEITMAGKRQQLITTCQVDCLAMAWLSSCLVRNQWECHKTFIHFWLPWRPVSSSSIRPAIPSVGTTDNCFILIRTHQCTIPTYAWTAFPFIPSVHHKITLVVSGKRQQLIKTVTTLIAEGAC